MFLEKCLYWSECILCAIFFDFVEDFSEVIVSSADGFENGLSIAFSCDFFGTASFNGTELVYETVFEIIITAHAVHGGMDIATGIGFSGKVDGVD